MLALALLLPSAAAAGTPEDLSALFVQACLPFAGRPDALRHWAAEAHLPEVADPPRAAFLHGAPGKVFDASNQVGKFVLVSSDDGLCAVVTDHAGDAETARALEQSLATAGVRLKLVAERNDKLNPPLHHREYLAATDKRIWRILAETVRGASSGQAMLTCGTE